jgi:hypothetical protein
MMGRSLGGGSVQTGGKERNWPEISARIERDTFPLSTLSPVAEQNQRQSHQDFCGRKNAYLYALFFVSHSQFLITSNSKSFSLISFCARFSIVWKRCSWSRTASILHSFRSFAG